MQEINKMNVNKLSVTLGKIIEKHRKSLGKTAYGISAECGIRKSTWRYVEQGVDIRLSTLWRIAEGLDIDIVDLIKELKKDLGEKFTLID